MQRRLESSQKLLNANGQIEFPGYATDLHWEYSRHDIRAPKYRIKEWDYYIIMNDQYAIAMTIADNGYMGFISSSIMEWDSQHDITTAVMTPFPMGKLGMPPTTKSGNAEFTNSRVHMKFAVQNDTRKLEMNFKNYDQAQTLQGSVQLYQNPDMDTMVIATPFHKKNAFYYNQKINCMPASGHFTLGEREYIFDPSNSFGTLDWGRGVWTYANTWYWASASGIVDGHPFGFNLGYGFGDTRHASENMLFYDNVAHKLDQITFHISDDFLAPWTFSSNDDRFNMTFTPILDRADDTNILILQSKQHQVFGRFSGTAILDDGQQIVLKDFLGFAEEVMNRW